MRQYCAAFLAGLLALGPCAAGAEEPEPAGECRLRIEAPLSSWIIQGYDPFGTDVPLDEYDVTFVNDGDAPCMVRSSLDLAGEPFGLDQGAAQRISYLLIDRSDNHDVTPRTGTTLPDPNRPVLTVLAHGQLPIGIRLSVDPSAIRGDGTFTQNARIDAVDENGLALASKQVLLGLEVDPAALVGLSGAFRLSQGQAMIDLGELQEGVAPLLLSLYVQSTRPYTISFDSTNSGQLRLAGSDWAIPYQLMVADRTLALDGLAEYAPGMGTALERQSIPLNFAIGDASDKRAGKYSDVITVSIAPQ
jgi:hypothetical protein